MASEPKYGRRDFFKDSVLSVAKAAKEYAAHADAAPEKPAPAIRTDWLRPPGAVSEALFLERCTQCGDCNKACPHDAIVPHADGTPVIYPDQMPCYLCDDVPCIAACAACSRATLSRSFSASISSRIKSTPASIRPRSSRSSTRPDICWTPDRMRSM